MDTIFDDPKTRQSIQLIEQAFLKIASDASVLAEFPDFKQSAETFIDKKEKIYDEDAEIAFLDLYCTIHRAGSTYSESERELLDGKKGYFNHPGGISPLIKAASYISNNAIVADLGAGNGLQGLLFQYLYPHQYTMQIELSAEMIRIGKIYQQALGIPEDRVKWINDDIMNVDLNDIDFLYLYRPSKPIKNGVQLYEVLVKKLQKREKPLVIFSIADCLRDFLDSSYKVFYHDGHLTCFKKTIA